MRFRRWNLSLPELLIATNKFNLATKIAVKKKKAFFFIFKRFFLKIKWKIYTPELTNIHLTIRLKCLCKLYLNDMRLLNGAISVIDLNVATHLYKLVTRKKMLKIYIYILYTKTFMILIVTFIFYFANFKIKANKSGRKNIKICRSHLF